MRIENGKRILEPGDKIRVPNAIGKCYTTVQIVEITHQDDFGDEGMQVEFWDTKGYYRSWKQRYDGGFVLNNMPVPEGVKENVFNYLKERLPSYELAEVLRGSEHPDDHYLYMVIAKHENGAFGVWTSWNETTHSLNFGHYDIESYEEAKSVCKEYFHKVR